MLLLAFYFLPALVLGQDNSSIVVITTNDTASAAAVNATTTFFEGIDTDNDGFFNRADVDLYFITYYDTDNDTEVTKDEFDGFIEKHRPFMKNYIGSIFDEFDVSKDGNLDDDDFTVAFTAADSNDDDMISKEEFDDLFLPVFDDAIRNAVQED